MGQGEDRPGRDGLLARFLRRWRRRDPEHPPAGMFTARSIAVGPPPQPRADQRVGHDVPGGEAASVGDGDELLFGPRTDLTDELRRLVSDEPEPDPVMQPATEPETPPEPEPEPEPRPTGDDAPDHPAPRSARLAPEPSLFGPDEPGPQPDAPAAGSPVRVHDERLDRRPGPIRMSPSEAVALAKDGPGALRRRLRRGRD